MERSLPANGHAPYRRGTAIARLLAGAGLASLLAWPAAASTPGGNPQRLEDLPRDKYGELVRQGYRIFTDTPNQARRYSGNALSCGSCHLDAGRRAGAAPMWAAWGMYPAYLAKSDRVAGFDERIQQCFRFSLNGFPPPADSQEVKALMAYAHWLSRGVPVGQSLPGRGFPTVPRTGADPDPQRGKVLYAQRCASCHGRDGEGQAGFPPLWGARSFNKGAGLNRIDLMAGFLKANMPYGRPDLDDQSALDLAAWITLQERWPDPRKGLLRGLLEN
ncbi:c-type cytochrome [Chitinimonas koreensis]|uniref:c-type cytochrome n=1 Tax=Chitinimonas koreensis TaxID=356302 RepID=UPI00040C823A|nr:c-type cytochrome [Chitinimonas koreensis]QNM97014.1 c-type cytochrome [Chitinimonas koreensis]